MRRCRSAIEPLEARSVPTTFTNPAAITIPDASTASPYPSTIVVSGMAGTVTKATVTLNGLSHNAGRDLYMLLVAPNGVNALLMSDVGGPTIGSVTLALDDAAATLLLTLGTLTSGTFRPANFDSSDSFPAPAPAPSGGSALSVFNGLNPNGTWSLYVVDD